MRRSQALLANMKRMKAQPQHLIVSSSMHYYQEYSRLAPHARARARTLRHPRAVARMELEGRRALSRTPAVADCAAATKINPKFSKTKGRLSLNRGRYLRYFDSAFAE